MIKDDARVKTAKKTKKQGRKATIAEVGKLILGPKKLRNRASQDASPASRSEADTSDLTLSQIIRPVMPWKDVERFLLDRGWSYTKGDALSAVFYVFPRFKDLPKTELMWDGVRGEDYCDETELKEFFRREYGWTADVPPHRKGRGRSTTPVKKGASPASWRPPSRVQPAGALPGTDMTITTPFCPGFA